MVDRFECNRRENWKVYVTNNFITRTEPFRQIIIREPILLISFAGTISGDPPGSQVKLILYWKPLIEPVLLIRDAASPLKVGTYYNYY